MEISLPLRTHLAHQLLKARIRAQRIEAGFDRENHNGPIPFLIRRLEIVQRFLLLVESEANHGEVISGDEIMLGFFLQTSENLSGFRLASCRSKAVRKLGQTNAAVGHGLQDFLRFCDRLRVHAFLSIDPGQPEMRPIVIGIKL